MWAFEGNYERFPLLKSEMPNIQIVVITCVEQWHYNVGFLLIVVTSMVFWITSMEASTWLCGHMWMGNPRAQETSKPNEANSQLNINTCVFQCMQNYCLFRNYCWRHFFCLRTVFAFLSCCMCLPVLKRRKKPNETAKKTNETAKKIKSPKCGDWNSEKKMEPAKI